MRLLIARHGQTDWNIEPMRCQGWIDTDLNDTGKIQAEAIARQLRAEKISRIFTSHLKRALQTAEIISSRLDIPYTVDPRLAEAKKGDWQGKTFNEIEKEYPDLWPKWLQSPFSAPIPGGESVQEAVQRLAMTIKEIFDSEDDDVLVITHGNLISAMRCMNSGESFDCFHEFHPQNGQIFEVDPLKIIAIAREFTAPQPGSAKVL